MLYDAYYSISHFVVSNWYFWPVIILLAVIFFLITGQLVSKLFFLALTWCFTVFAVLMQCSDQLIDWLRPHMLSIEDERFFYTLIPMMLNILILVTLMIMNERKFFKLLTYVTLVLNIFLFIYYVTYQYFR